MTIDGTSAFVFGAETRDDAEKWLISLSAALHDALSTRWANDWAVQPLFFIFILFLNVNQVIRKNCNHLPL